MMRMTSISLFQTRCIRLDYVTEHKCKRIERSVLLRERCIV
jgi:hypothetical protein